MIPDTITAPIPRKYVEGATHEAPPKIAPATIAINGSFRSTRDKCCRHNCHLTVTVTLDCTGSHDTGNTTSGTNQHWDKGFTGQTETAENTVHDKLRYVPCNHMLPKSSQK